MDCGPFSHHGIDFIGHESLVGGDIVKVNTRADPHIGSRDHFRIRDFGLLAGSGFWPDVLDESAPAPGRVPQFLDDLDTVSVRQCAQIFPDGFFFDWKSDVDRSLVNEKITGTIFFINDLVHHVADRGGNPIMALDIRDRGTDHHGRRMGRQTNTGLLILEHYLAGLMNPQFLDCVFVVDGKNDHVHEQREDRNVDDVHPTLDGQSF